MIPIKTKAALYVGGSSHAFPIGADVPLPDEHARALHASGHVVMTDKTDLDPPNLKMPAAKDK